VIYFLVAHFVCAIVDLLPVLRGEVVRGAGGREEGGMMRMARRKRGERKDDRNRMGIWNLMCQRRVWSVLWDDL